MHVLTFCRQTSKVMGFFCGPNSRSKHMCSSVENVNMLAMVAKGFAGKEKAITSNRNWLSDVHDKSHTSSVSDTLHCWTVWPCVEMRFVGRAPL